MLTDTAIAARAGGLLERWAGEKSADTSDTAILAAINKLISMQEGDNDSPSDAKVLAALKQAKSAQEADIKEES